MDNLLEGKLGLLWSILIATLLCVILAAMLFGPIALAFACKSFMPLWLYIIDFGVVAGTSFYFENYA